MIRVIRNIRPLRYNKEEHRRRVMLPVPSPDGKLERRVPPPNVSPVRHSPFIYYKVLLPTQLTWCIHQLSHQRLYCKNKLNRKTFMFSSRWINRYLTFFPFLFHLFSLAFHWLWFSSRCLFKSFAHLSNCLGCILQLSNRNLLWDVFKNLFWNFAREFNI